MLVQVKNKKKEAEGTETRGLELGLESGSGKDREIRSGVSV